MKIFTWSVSIILGLIVSVLAFLSFFPGYNIYFVRSESMVPAINLGDMVIAGPANVNGIKPGDIITYELGKNLITHRVLSINGETLITKGDANEDPDPRPVQFSQVKNRYLFKIPYVGILTLDGTANDIWIFKMTSTLTTASSSQVSLINGARAANVYWVVGSTANLGANSIFKGNILAAETINIATGAALEGRALARNAAVTLDTNTITKPAP